MHRYATLSETLYFGFGVNDATGAGADGSSPAFSVRLGGAASGAAPVLTGTPTLLSHASYTDGSYEIAVAATTGNGFAAGNTYLVFCTAAVNGLNPAGFVGSFTLGPAPASLTSVGLDAVLVESSISAGASLTDDASTQLTSINARQALALALSALAGVLAGAAGTTITTKQTAKPAGNTRITATVDADGNRSALTLKVPT